MLRTGQTLTAVALVGATAVAVVLGARWAVDELAPPRCVFVVADQEVSLTPEQAANAATIAGVAVQRGLPARAATIAITTAIQESKLRNLSYGHADSLGLFQQRPSQGWGSVEQVRDPVYASNAFYDALVEVDGWETGIVTEVAQEVQRSAFPDAYADHEWEGRVLASVLTGQEAAGTVMGCRLRGAEGTGSTQTLAAKVADQLGRSASVGPDGRTLHLELPDPATAWSVGTWAVSHADSEDVVRVTVGDREWRRSGDGLRWHDAGSSQAGTSVVVEVG